jgi:hypothetical protein
MCCCLVLEQVGFKWNWEACARVALELCVAVLVAAMADNTGAWKSEDQKSLRELSATLASFTESQAHIKLIFSLYDHDSDGFLTTNQTALLMRKLGFTAPKAWDYVYRDAVTLPLVGDMLRCLCVMDGSF